MAPRHDQFDLSHYDNDRVDPAILAQIDFTGGAGRYTAVPLDGHAKAVARDARDAADRLEKASAVGDLAVVKKELAHALSSSGIDDLANRPNNCLWAAVKGRHYHVVALLLQHRIPIDDSAVRVATKAKDVKMFDLFLQHGWNVNETMNGTTPSALAYAVDEDSQLTTWLLQRGADPNKRCDFDLTPLSVAVQHAPMATIRMLFQYGGSIEYGQLLHYAVWRELPDYMDVLNLILSKKPLINDVMYQKDPHSYMRRRAYGLGTPLHYAAEMNRLDVVQTLIEHGAHPLIRDSRGATVLARAEYGRCQPIITYLRPIAAKATEPPYQFTKGNEATTWG